MSNRRRAEGVPSVSNRLLRGVAVPNFGDQPTGLIEPGVAAEQAGFDGFFLWDHIVFSNAGTGHRSSTPGWCWPWVAARTSLIKLGTMITPVPRRRPWQLARQITSLDRLSGGRMIFGVGIGSPAYGDFGIFGEPSGDRVRADMLDEGLDVLNGLWSGERFSYAGQHFTVDPVRFTPCQCSGRECLSGSAVCCPPPGPLSAPLGGTGPSRSGTPNGRWSGRRPKTSPRYGTRWPPRAPPGAVST